MATFSSNFSAILAQAGGGGGGEDLAATLAIGNTTGGNDIIFTGGDGIDTADNGGGAGFDLNITGSDAGGGVFAGGDINLTPGLGSGGGANGVVNVTGDLVVSGNLILSNLIAGTGTPEGAVVATIGSIFQRTDGAGGNSVYFKQANTGVNTGWVPAGPHVRENFTASGSPNFVTSQDVFSDPFNLLGPPGTNGTLRVYWNGLLQREGGGDDYTVAYNTPGPGMTTVTFNVTPPGGDFITIEYLPE